MVNSGTVGVSQPSQRSYFQSVPVNIFLCLDLTLARNDVSLTSLENRCMQRKKTSVLIFALCLVLFVVFAFNEAHQAQFHLLHLTMMSHHINFSLHSVCRSSAKLFSCQQNSWRQTSQPILNPHFKCALQGDFHLLKKGPLFAHKTLHKPGGLRLFVHRSFSGHLCITQTNDERQRNPRALRWMNVLFYKFVGRYTLQGLILHLLSLPPFKCWEAWSHVACWRRSATCWRWFWRE